MLKVNAFQAEHAAALNKAERQLIVCWGKRIQSSSRACWRQKSAGSSWAWAEAVR